MGSHKQTQIEMLGSAGAARAALSRAVKEAGRAHGVRAAVEVQPSPVDFTALGLEGWKSKGALSLFRQNDGRVLFTDGRDVARRTTRDGPFEIQLFESAGGHCGIDASGRLAGIKRGSAARSAHCWQAEGRARANSTGERDGGGAVTTGGEAGVAAGGARHGCRCHPRQSASVAAVGVDFARRRRRGAADGRRRVRGRRVR
eukprot:6179940-Pleurochrysis_carterae.AAC.1